MKKILILWCVAWGITSPVCAQTPTSAQTMEMVSIEGVVTDAAGKLPLPGVYVSVGKNIHGTMTDKNGQYVLRIPRNAVPETKIKFSQLGLKTVEVEYRHRTRIDVVMEEDAQMLQEIVVT
ncbi:MAG: carboxypeptidase-like regulatory domain-containing protein, partial [Prevotellaceae bacterium]|nr:carboxypeptidase-like regulatory domain-containing protein [Prevotellaceae bacterium]